jgi:hypothetical protein
MTGRWVLHGSALRPAGLYLPYNSGVLFVIVRVEAQASYLMEIPLRHIERR